MLKYEVMSEDRTGTLVGTGNAFEGFEQIETFMYFGSVIEAKVGGNSEKHHLWGNSAMTRL